MKKKLLLLNFSKTIFFRTIIFMSSSFLLTACGQAGRLYFDTEPTPNKPIIEQSSDTSSTSDISSSTDTSSSTTKLELPENGSYH